ncbi:MAG: hypothetical protein AVDCRST_MAG58-1966 [uncultured Rubrobacteraceae bacterium]|uniref:Uncharacterized protein n=1 Tax=uncultured Rubrobacteraceae bacterium TaxID=349277 RepID=A0A6J4R498_9ACTN|nr:MAG: hypothetical protein AVDCRST_MAG58-1966 [uncultured Rubrobacteraceae bacterium]
MPQQGIPERLGLPGGEPDGLEKASLPFGAQQVAELRLLDESLLGVQ